MNCPICLKDSSIFAWRYEEHNIYQCQRCQLEFVSPFSQGNIEFYQNHEIYSFVDGAEEIPKPPYSILNEIIKYTKTYKKKNLKILDYGCGFGGYSLALSGLGHDVLACDFNPHLTEYIESNLGIPSSNDSLSELKQKSLRFDLIILNQVLEHVDKPNEIFNNFFDLLEVNGSIFLSVPNRDYFKGVVSKGNLPDANYPPHHISFWNEVALRNFLTVKGFCPVYVASDSWPSKDDIFNKLKFIKLQFLRRFFSAFITKLIHLISIKGPHLIAIGRKID